jgi:hypothetical protein
LHAVGQDRAGTLPSATDLARTFLRSGFLPERTEVPMYQLLVRGLGRSLEWMLLAIVCGCTLWVTFLALGFRAPMP